MRPNANEARRIFRITTRESWKAVCQEGIIPDTHDDRRDGFIHLSALDQLAGTLAKHFKDQVDLMLIEFDAEALGSDLRWEPSRGGELYPHLYAPLPTTAASAVRSLQLDSKGVPVVPEEMG
jgi:uncharacterized protein (DUF952 family)